MLNVLSKYEITANYEHDNKHYFLSKTGIFEAFILCLLCTGLTQNQFKFGLLSMLKSIGVGKLLLHRPIIHYQVTFERQSE